MAQDIIKSVSRCEPVYTFGQGSSFNKGDHMHNANDGLFIVECVSGAIGILGRLAILVFLDKSSNQHITQNDLDSLQGKEIDPSTLDR